MTKIEDIISPRDFAEVVVMLTKKEITNTIAREFIKALWLFGLWKIAKEQNASTS